MVTQLESSIVRIFNQRNIVIGAGFLISDRHVVTCAHVVAEALGLPLNHPKQPSGEIALDFPLIALGHQIDAKAVFWLPIRSESSQPDGDEDLAVLEITIGLPSGCGPASLTRENAVVGAVCETMSFPTGHDKGKPASGIICRGIGGGCQILRAVDEIGSFVREGFSGAPVWSGQAVVGMIVRTNKDEKEAYLIPGSLLIEKIAPKVRSLIRQPAGEKFVDPDRKQRIPSQLLPRSKQILLPLTAGGEDREALLIDAFYLYDPLLYGIDREGSPNVFTSRLIARLIDYGCLAEGEHALARLLSAARYLYGQDKHQEIDELIDLANDLCGPAAPVSRHAPVPAPAGHSLPIQTLATPIGERRPTVFISYVRGEEDFANRLIGDLNAAGHTCWIDTSSIKGGDEWVMTIAEGIINSYALVVIVTLKALRSKWVQKEILWALQKRKPVIPLILEDVMDEAGFLPLVDCQGVKLFGNDYLSVLRRLLESLPGPQLPDAPDLEVVEAQAGEGPDDNVVPVVRISPLHNDRRKRELAYLERLKLEELLNTDKYTPMAGVSEQRTRREILPRAEMRPVFELLLMEMDKDREPRQERRRFENAVEEIRRIRRAVLLGEPGGGKTTTIWKLAAELVGEAERDREAVMPLLIRLGRWTEAEERLGAFIESQLGELGIDLDQLLSEKRAALLLDGLNELPTGQREEKYPQVKGFIEQHPALLAIVSCRELDYTVDLGFDRINITPLDPVRVKEFVRRYLGDERGEALFWRLAGGDEVRDLWGVWEKAGANFELFWAAPDIPREDPNVYRLTSGRQDRVWLEKVRGKHSMMELASNPYMLLMLTSVYARRGDLPENRGELFRLFVKTLLERERIPEAEQGALTDGLARVAYEMQVQRDRDDRGEALTVLPGEKVKAILGERLLYLAGSASVLSIGEQVRFTHQLLQEYFVARHMEIEVSAGRLKAKEIWLPERWWERTNWEEAAILYAGLHSDDCTPVVEWVAEANPEVAAQCVVRSGAGLAEATRERLRSTWIARLDELESDPKPEARAAVGRALGLTALDNRDGVGVKPVTLNGCSITLPDIDWVEIPGGEFQYGDESEGAATPERVKLPAFHISRYPVTYAQFQTFLDDPEGYPDPRWFEGLAASDDDRRMNEQWFKFANHPREMVNWYQATAFCRWLSWRLGGGYDLDDVEKWAVRLPTEYEWEKAARGTDGRIYPYGDEFDAAKGNTDATGLNQTSAVGIFPKGASPYGVMDLSGNVWEWCLTNYDKPKRDVGREKLDTADTRVLRGGSWLVLRDGARAVFRDLNHPAVRRNFVGFRVVGVARSPSQNT